MPRPRRRKIVRRAATTHVSLDHQPALESSSSLPTPTEPLKSSPPKRAQDLSFTRRPTRRSSALSLNEVATSESETRERRADESESVNKNEKRGGKSRVSEASVFDPTLTSTPKSEATLQPTSKQVRPSAQKAGLPRRKSSTTVNDGVDADIDDDNRSTPSSESSDPFGFSKIRGVRVAGQLSTSPSLPSTPTSPSAFEEIAHTDDKPDPINEDLLSSPLSDLRGPTPSPSRLYMTDNDDADGLPASPLRATNANSPLKQRRVERQRRSRKESGEVTTAQLTSLLPRRATSGRERTRTRTQSGAGDDDEDDSNASSEDDEDGREYKQPQKRRRKRLASGKENKRELSAKGRTKKSENLKKHVDEDGSDFDLSEEEESPDSDVLRKTENERLRKKFSEVDEWNLEVESVPVGSDSSFT